MRIVFFFFLCLLIPELCFGQDDSAKGKIQKVFTVAINDSVQVEVLLQYDDRSNPEHYVSHVNTAVCEDGLCRPMIIDVYWDALGNFLRYSLPEGEVLTKLDHHEFSLKDHEQLYKILSDKGSILRDYPASDLIETKIGRGSDDVDAVSAATRVDVKESVVSGAVYSTYVLWHIVNGPISSRIMEYSKPYLTRQFIEGMFYSGNFYYEYFALNAIEDQDSLRYLPQVIHLIRNGRSYIPYFAMDKVPASAWAIDSCQVALLESFRSADFELKNSMLASIDRVSVSTKALALLVAALDDLTDPQRVRALDIIERNEVRLSDDARTALSKWKNDSCEVKQNTN